MITFLQLGNYGRLGNQMFQIASTIGIAVQRGFDVAFPAWINYDQAKKTRQRKDEILEIFPYFKNKLHTLNGNGFDRYVMPWGYNPGLVETLPDNVSILGHMQSEKYFMHCHKLIRYYFEFAQRIQSKLPENFNHKSIAVHYRGGDYGDEYHPRQTVQYYERALANLPALPIYVFSDEPETAKQIFGNNVTYIETNNYIVDLFLMTQCQHFVISNSTYAWWGAWLATQPGKKVVAPAIWFGPAAKKISAKDIYCDGWKVI